MQMELTEETAAQRLITFVKQDKLKIPFIEDLFSQNLIKAVELFKKIYYPGIGSI